MIAAGSLVVLIDSWWFTGLSMAEEGASKIGSAGRLAGGVDMLVMPLLGERFIESRKAASPAGLEAMARRQWWQPGPVHGLYFSLVMPAARSLATCWIFVKQRGSIRTPETAASTSSSHAFERSAGRLTGLGRGRLAG